MKKLAMCLMSAMVVLSLAACTPTPEKQAETAETFETQETGGAEDKVPDPDAPALTPISVYAINEDKTGLTQEMDGVESLDGQSVISKMAEYDILPANTIVLSFEDISPDAEETTAASEESTEENADPFAEQPPVEIAVLTLSQLPEENRDLVIAAIGNTFTENFNIETLKINVKDDEVAEVTYNDSYKKIK